MIAMLTGTLVHRSANRGIVDVRGVGYEVYATSSALERWEAEDGIQVHVCTQVREDSITLYGFVDDAERVTFMALLGVSKIGPKVALSTLETFRSGELAEAIESDNIAALSQIPGVGKRTAQRMALELKGKLKADFVVSGKAPTRAGPTDPLPLALARLGYTKSEIDRAQAALKADGVAVDSDVGERLRHSLKTLSRQS